jgi:hypothetical protein
MYKLHNKHYNDECPFCGALVQVRESDFEDPTTVDDVKEDLARMSNMLDQCQVHNSNTTKFLEDLGRVLHMLRKNFYMNEED